MLDLFCIGVIGNQIIVFIVPDQVPGTDMIDQSFVPRLHLFLQIPLGILKGDLTVFTDCCMYQINSIINAFIHRLHPAGKKDLPAKLLRLRFTHQTSQLLDQLFGFSG